MSAPPRKRPRVSPPPSSAESAAPPPVAVPSSGPAAAAAGAERTPPAGLSIRPPAQYLSAGPTPFQLPFHLTSFSYSPSRELLLDDARKDEALAYYREPPLGSDLNYGFEQAVWRDGSVDEGLDALLETLSSWARKNAGPAADDLLSKISVITWRGMLTKLMLAVYEADNVANGRRADGWEMNAMVVDGCLYLEESNPPAKLTAKSASELSNALPSYYGYSFESYCTTAGPSSSATSPAPAPPHSFHVPNTNVQWCSVVKTNLGGFRALVGGEVDCVRSDAPADARKVGTKDFVELKTNLVIQSQRDEVNFERLKLLKHYVQSFLLGVPRITVGFRTRAGELAALQHFNTLEIPRLVRGKPHAWDPAACLASAKELLAFLHAQIKAHEATQRAEAALADACDLEDAGMREWPVFRVSFDPAKRLVSLRKLTSDEVRGEVWAAKRPVEGEESEGDGRIGFLLASWVREVKARRERLSAGAAAKKSSAEESSTGSVGPVPPNVDSANAPPPSRGVAAGLKR
ncbi:hypothetical protein Rhopal_003001-T1 [Rhodotorula paludigena]|uniref:Decapping nuclease n=1 Tax=Rhodotorula paludigena TaxID=86838 RepID=A0AAV5GC14_9BASI|nr:hypothetical protein Rhopal_003001-T1 [Rhodotorula paludigena]